MSSSIPTSLDNLALVASMCERLATNSTTSTPADKQASANKEINTLAELSTPSREPLSHSPFNNHLAPSGLNLEAIPSKEAEAESQLPAFLINISSLPTKEACPVQPAKRKRLPDKADTNDPAQKPNIRPESPKPKRVRKSPPKKLRAKPADAIAGSAVQEEAQIQEDTVQREEVHKPKKTTARNPLKKRAPKPSADATTGSSLQLESVVQEEELPVPTTSKFSTAKAIGTHKHATKHQASKENMAEVIPVETDDSNTAAQNMDIILPSIEPHLNASEAKSQPPPQEATPAPSKSPIASLSAALPKVDLCPAQDNLPYDQCVFAKPAGEPSTESAPTSVVTPPTSSPPAEPVQEESFDALHMLADLALQQEYLPIKAPKKKVTWEDMLDGDIEMNDTPAPPVGKSSSEQFAVQASIADPDSDEVNQAALALMDLSQDGNGQVATQWQSLPVAANSTKRKRKASGKYHPNPHTRQIYCRHQTEPTDGNESSSSIDAPNHTAKYRKLTAPVSDSIREGKKVIPSKKTTKPRKSTKSTNSSLAPATSAPAVKQGEATKAPAPAAQEEVSNSAIEQ